MSTTPPLQGRAALAAALSLFAVGCTDDGTSPGTPASLAIVVSPVSLSTHDLAAPAVTVVARDGRGETVESWAGDVSLALEGGAQEATLDGTTTRAATGGIALFDDLRISSPGTGYRLVARAGGLAEAASDPFDVHSVFGTASVSAGLAHTCALLEDGAAYCWGANDLGQLGTGDTEERVVATPVETDLRFAVLDTRRYHTCALALDEDVYCWGLGALVGDGQASDGPPADRSLPVRVDLPGPVRTLSVGYNHTCAVLDDHRAFCWGSNVVGALGTGAADSLHTSPVQVDGDHEWAKVEAGLFHSCGLTTDGEAYCWGYNLYGEIGVGQTLGEYYGPTLVSGGHLFTDLAAGGGSCHGATCGITADGVTLCWGRNYQRGEGLSNEELLVEPTPLAGDPGFVEIDVGPFMICGRTAEGETQCIGEPQAGMFPTTTKFLPLRPELEIAALALGEGHACVVTADGGTLCWGLNDRAQLGSGKATGGWYVPRGVWDSSYERPGSYY